MHLSKNLIFIAECKSISESGAKHKLKQEEKEAALVVPIPIVGDARPIVNENSNPATPKATKQTPDILDKSSAKKKDKKDKKAPLKD